MASSAPRASEERLGAEFFDRSVHEVARELIGCRLFYDGCGGTIVETESYERDDPACHAYVGLTERTEVLFGPPGRAYVYLSYGIHSLLNAVAEPEGEAAAVLIRALEPTAGLEQMRARRGGRPDHELCSGPGKLTEALGIGLDANDADLGRDPFLLLPPDQSWLGRGRHRAPDRDHQSGRAALALLRRRQPYVSKPRANIRGRLTGRHASRRVPPPLGTQGSPVRPVRPGPLRLLRPVPSVRGPSDSVDSLGAAFRCRSMERAARRSSRRRHRLLRLFRRPFGLDLLPGRDHAGPDQRREGAAHHRAAVVEGRHRRHRVGVADPDAGGHFFDRRRRTRRRRCSRSCRSCPTGRRRRCWRGCRCRC